MKIKTVRAIPVRLARPNAQSLGTAGSPSRLCDGEGYRWSVSVPALYSTDFETAIVQLMADDGTVAWGEAQAPLAPEVVCEIVRLLLRPVIEGAEVDGAPESVEALWDRMYQTMRVRGQTGGFMLDAISGVDLALWDLWGKVRHCPVSELIGEASSERVPAYLSGLPGGTVGECVEHARRAAASGFRIFKIFHSSTPNDLIERLDALRSELGPGCRFAVDGLWRFDEAGAIEFGRQLDRRDALWFEAPLAPEDPAAHSRVARAIATPVAIGESYRTRFEVEPFLQGGAIAILQPDLGRCGLTEFRRLVRLAAQYGTRVIPHVSIAMGPQIAAAIHASAAYGCDVLEYNPSVLETANRFLLRPIIVDGASYAVPEGDGLGVNLTSEILYF